MQSIDKQFVLKFISKRIVILLLTKYYLNFSIENINLYLYSLSTANKDMLYRLDGSSRLSRIQGRSICFSPIMKYQKTTQILQTQATINDRGKLFEDHSFREILSLSYGPEVNDHYTYSFPLIYRTLTSFRVILLSA